MVLQVVRWNIRAEKVSEYPKWAQGAIQRTISVPGVAEFRGYRPASGDFQVVVTYEFADLLTWAAWYEHADTQAMIDELHTVATDVTLDLWGPSPIVPAPVRPGG